MVDWRLWLKSFCYSRIAGAIAIVCISLLAGCGPTADPPRPESAGHDEVRHDEARRDEPRGRESRHESNHERRRESGHAPGHERERTRDKGETAETPHATSGQPHDLSADEAQGGHTLSRHVGRSDADLQERLERERNISAASTYTDRATAEAVVGRVLEHNSKIERWEEREGRRPNLALDYHGEASQPIGRCMQRGSSVAVPATDALVVLKARDGGGFFVLTTYPECPR